MTGKKKEFLLIDGSAFFWRCFHAVPPRSAPDGTPVNAVEGLAATLLKPVLERNLSSHMAVFFDAGGRTFRHVLYPSYKAHRPPAPAELTAQAPLVREAVRAYGIPCVEMPGFEADDLMATATRLALEQDADVVLVSADKDLMQLIGPRVRMYDQQRRRLIRESEVAAKFGVAPHQVIDVQAMAGDAVDGIPGVPGIGLKIGAELVNEFGDLEGILANLDAIPRERLRRSLEEHADQARLSRVLATLKEDAVLPGPVDEYVVSGPPADPRAFLARLGLPARLAPLASRRFPEWRGGR